MLPLMHDLQLGCPGALTAKVVDGGRVALVQAVVVPLGRWLVVLLGTKARGDH
jgi:hypothetical protein